MRVTSITEYTPRAGDYVEWTLSATGDPLESSVPPSFNQGFHLGDLGAADRVWIAGSFDTDGPLDVTALEWAFTRLVDRHETLRSSFVRTDSGITRVVHAPGDVELGRATRTRFDSAVRLAAHLRRSFDQHCDARGFPSYTCSAVDRPDGSTVLCAFDHANVDALSIAVVISEVHELYDAHRRCPSDPSTNLAPVGSFVDYCRIEAVEPEVDPDDDRMRAWAKFLRDCGGTTPRFPFELGVPAGDTATQATTSIDLLDADRTAAFERAVIEAGGGMFAGLVATVGRACAEIGGPDRLPLLFPLHTRHEKQWSRALGWFTTNAPMTVEVADTWQATVAASQRAFRAALPLASVPVAQVLRRLGEDFTLTRQDVFMVSYVDYTRVAGAERFESLRAHHISNVTVADDAQLWISRTARGLSLRSRFPETVEARKVMAAFTEALTATMGGVAVPPGDRRTA